MMADFKEICYTILLISYFIFSFHLNHVASCASSSQVIRVSANPSKENQCYFLEEGARQTLFKFRDLDNAAASSETCSGSCTINNKTKISLDLCNVENDHGKPLLNALMNTHVAEYFAGVWNCELKSPSSSSEQKFAIHNPTFRIFTVMSNNSLSDVAPVSYRVNLKDDSKEADLSLEKGNHSIEISIETKEPYEKQSCLVRCTTSQREEIDSKSCHVEDNNTFKVVLNEAIIASSETWNCSLRINGEQGRSSILSFNLHVKVPEEYFETGLVTTIVLAVGIILLLIIAGQTFCIIHYRNKAIRAEINENLTPKAITEAASAGKTAGKNNFNTDTQASSTLDVRYVSKGQDASDESLYEALDTLKAMPPPVPPIETIPLTPKPIHVLRSASQQNLAVPGICGTTPRMHPKLQKGPAKFNTVGRGSSLERIQSRPPLPLPSDIYEDVTITQGHAPSKRKPIFGIKQHGFKLPAAANAGIEDRSALLPGQKMAMFERTSETALKPRAVQTPGGLKPCFPEKLNETPGPSGMKPSLGKAPPPAAKPFKGGMQILPSLINAANLKAVKLNPAMEASNRPIPKGPANLPPSNAVGKARSKPPMPQPEKTKPPMPLPEPEDPPEPIAEDFADDDHEFDTYDELPDYRIYGNTQPIKFK